MVLAGCTDGASGRAAGGAAADPSGLPTTRPILESDLDRYPQARLHYPGSRLVKAVGADQTPTRDGEEPNPAYVGGIFTVRATPTQLYRWLQATLSGEGFSPTTDYRPSTEISGQAWQRHHRLQLQVGVLDPERLRADQGIEVQEPPGTIAYEALLVGYAPGLPKD